MFVRCFPRLQSPNTEIGTELLDREAGKWEALDGLICNGATCWEDMVAQLYCHGMGVHVRGKVTWLLEATQGWE